VKRLFIALSVALLALAFMVSPALAWGETDTVVSCSDIEVSNPNPVIGAVVTFSGTVDIVSEASASGLGSGAYAGSNAWYCVTDPDGTAAIYDSNSVTDWGFGFLCANADGSQTFAWSVDVRLMAGEWMVSQGGFAEAWFYTILPPGYDSSEAYCLTTITVKPHNVIKLPSHPVLIIETPNGRGCFFPSDGWGEIVTKDIVLEKDGWKVEIDEGTILQMDGKWHKRSWLIVDEDGGVTCKYGNAEREAENCGLSKPINITTP